jgi:hypothetical protein
LVFKKWRALLVRQLDFETFAFETSRARGAQES